MSELRLQTITIERKSKLTTEVCINCGTLFAMDTELHDERQSDKQFFYCPNGHRMSYQGKSEQQKLKEQLDEARRRAERAEQNQAYWRDEAREASDTAKKERHRANGYKGHATRITKRAKAGVCPCCNRTFKQLAAHMATQHPTFTPLIITDDGVSHEEKVSV